MKHRFFSLFVMSVIFSVLCSSFVTVFGNQSNSLNSSAIKSDFSDDLKSKIQDLIANAVNGNIINSSTILTSDSNQSSSNIIMSKNKVTSSVNNNGNDSSTSSSSVIKDKVTTINGICNSEKVGGAGNDSLLSMGKCNDQLTGGPGADKFQCSEGNDTIKDYDPKEGDSILDKQNCEKILTS